MGDPVEVRYELFRERLAKLPLWATVAFAARCARRVQPLYRLKEDHPELAQHVRAVDLAIGMAWRSAATAAVGSFATNARAAAFKGAASAKAAAYAHAATDSAADAACAARDAAAAAARAAGVRTAAGSASTAATVVTDAAAAARDAYAASLAAYIDDADVVDADYERLTRLANEQRWTHETPVDPAILGPLWPEGEPAWFTEGKAWQERVLAGDLKTRIANSDPAPLVAVSFEGTVFTPEEIEACLTYVSELYRETGGIGLKVVKSGTLIGQRAEVVDES